jgi:transposase-like protein
VIVLSVRWYLRFALSYRDVEELLAERGIESTTPPSTAESSASRRCWPRSPGPADTPSVTAGRSMKVRKLGLLS